jgi:hypothetical protein
MTSIPLPGALTRARGKWNRGRARPAPRGSRASIDGLAGFPRTSNTSMTGGVPVRRSRLSTCVSRMETWVSLGHRSGLHATWANRVRHPWHTRHVPREPATDSLEPAADFREPTVEPREPTAEPWEPAADSLEPPADSKESAAASTEPAVASQRSPDAHGERRAHSRIAYSR